MNLAICGSIYSLMKRIFENAKEPLYGRATSRMLIKPFRIHTIKEILSDYNPSYSPEDLLAFYMITGGVAKYIEQLVIRKAFTKQAIFKTIFREGSYFLEEGKSVLVDEFGKDYGNLFGEQWDETTDNSTGYEGTNMADLVTFDYGRAYIVPTDDTIIIKVASKNRRNFIKSLFTSDSGHSFMRYGHVITADRFTELSSH